MEARELHQAFNNARSIIVETDRLATDIAELLSGRLRQVRSSTVLCNLKRELSHFNAATGKWKR